MLRILSVFVALGIHHAICHLWPVWIYSIFPHYLINGTIFEKKKVVNLKCWLWFSLQLLPETLLILRQFSDIITTITTNAHSLHVECPLFFLDFI